MEAKEFLMKAHAIFESKGMIKMLKEVKNKLKMLNSSVKLAAEVAAQEFIESGNEGGSDKELDTPEKNKAMLAGISGLN